MVFVHSGLGAIRCSCAASPSDFSEHSPCSTTLILYLGILQMEKDMHNKDICENWCSKLRPEERGGWISPVPWQTWQCCCSQNLHPPHQKCSGTSTSHTRVHRVNYTASSVKLKVINFTPYYMQGVQKNQKIGNERLAGALSGTRELTDLISSLIYDISTNSFGRSIK